MGVDPVQPGRHRQEAQATARPSPSRRRAAEAARIIAAAWAQDDDWGALVWLVMVTGMRRGEVLALRWSDVDLDAGCSPSAGTTSGRRRRGSRRTPRPTRCAGSRSIPRPVAILADHRARYEEQVRAVGVEPSDQAFVFSYQPLHDAPADPSAVTHRYGRMCAALGIDSHLHALRHYSATELLTAGVDLRTVAGRLGHGGGGATTLRVYAAWVGESDRKASEILGSRMRRSGSTDAADTR